MSAVGTPSGCNCCKGHIASEPAAPPSLSEQPYDNSPEDSSDDDSTMHMPEPLDDGHFDPYMTLLRFLCAFQTTGLDWGHLRPQLEERRMDPAEAVSGIQDVLDLAGAKLASLYVELGRHLDELETNNLPVIRRYEAMGAGCNAALNALQPLPTVSELVNRHPHRAAAEFHTQNAQFFARHRRLRAIGQTYSRRRFLSAAHTTGNTFNR